MLICAALLIQVDGLDHTTIIPCRRFHDGYKILKDLGYGPKTRYRVVDQGFINHNGDFLDRTDALDHAVKCGQLSATAQWWKDSNADSELSSADLY